MRFSARNRSPHQWTRSQLLLLRCAGKTTSSLAENLPELHESARANIRACRPWLYSRRLIIQHCEFPVPCAASQSDAAELLWPRIIFWPPLECELGNWERRWHRSDGMGGRHVSHWTRSAPDAHSGVSANTRGTLRRCYTTAEESVSGTFQGGRCSGGPNGSLRSLVLWR